MPLDANLSSQYQHLANDYLYNFPVRSVSEFPLVAKALGEVHYDYSMGSAYRVVKNARKMFYNVTQGSSRTVAPGTPAISTEIKSRISSIEGLLAAPRSYVASSRDDQEFRRIILSCVSAVQNKLQVMSLSEKEAYVEEQDENRKRIAAQQELFSKMKAPKPGDDASTITLESFVAENAVKVFKDKSSARIAHRFIVSEYEKASSNPGDELEQALRDQLLSEGLYEGEEQGEDLLNRLTGKRQPRVEGRTLVVNQEVLDEFIPEGVPRELLNM
ncbi:MAG: hypothetical protein ACI9YB_002581 [Halioglobus sp.]|jgi:hypothetical protein